MQSAKFIDIMWLKAKYEDPATFNYLNPFPDEQLILDGHRAKTSLPF